MWRTARGEDDHGAWTTRTAQGENGHVARTARVRTAPTMVARGGGESE
jgi:hypothetical protein